MHFYRVWGKLLHRGDPLVMSQKLPFFEHLKNKLKETSVEYKRRFGPGEIRNINVRVGERKDTEETSLEKRNTTDSNVTWDRTPMVELMKRSSQYQKY